MLVSIRPPVPGGTHLRSWRWRWLGLAALSTLGNVLSAGAAGAVLVALAWALRGAGWPVAPAALWLGVAVALLYLPRQLGLTELPPLVQSGRQVPRRWAFIYPA